MLVLSRHKNEVVVIKVGDVLIAVTVTEIRGDKVRLGVHAPEEVAIHRQEVYDAIQRDGEDTKLSRAARARSKRAQAEALIAQAKLLEQEGHS